MSKGSCRRVFDHLDTMENFLNKVYLAGLNNGIYAAKHANTSLLDDNPFDVHWLADIAEKATTDKDGDGYMLNALVDAIFRNADIPKQKTE